MTRPPRCRLETRRDATAQFIAKFGLIKLRNTNTANTVGSCGIRDDSLSVKLELVDLDITDANHPWQQDAGAVARQCADSVQPGCAEQCAHDRRGLATHV